MQLYRPNNPRQLKIASIGKASKEDKELVPFAIESAVGTSALTLTALLGALGLTAVDGMNTKAKASSFNPKNGSTYPEKLSAYECGFDPSVPPNKIDPFGSWSMMAFLLILTIGSLYEWKRGALDRE
ncbi:NADH-ubiquinone oxidoreductase chain 3 [Sesamum angolense]|uniref:NADH-ubiquinone oxidoreductase chain 3 n=1 Tax=Sesamum angolense TaxID=2727404 RepID=A0AAE1VSQ8_9LAMI|nr:NADH-ubiquinone oxidoreductase chain 3 [Sesamum angolense]